MTENHQPLVSLRQGTTDPRAVESYYDAFAETYDTTLADWRYRAPEEVAGLIAPFLAPGGEVLDIGCGTGLFGQTLRAQVDASLDGIDISSVSLQKAKARGVYRRLLQHDLQDLPLPVADDGHDAAVSVGVLTYIADARALLRDICRSVRPGGVVAFTQRSDLWRERGFDRLIADLAADGAWQPQHVSDPRPYLPGNDEFAEEINVIYALCRVA